MKLDYILNNSDHSSEKVLSAGCYLDFRQILKNTNISNISYCYWI